MASPPSIIAGLREIAGEYDALICDVWGVIHNGARSNVAACGALRKFRDCYGSVVLLSNAPRPVDDVKVQFAHFGVPEDCYDAIVTSGAAARDDLERRSADHAPKMFHLGPVRDRGIFEGLPVDCVSASEAEIILCTGLFDDDRESPADYRDGLVDLASRRVIMLCANPDLVVQRGGKLVYCAGALASEYEELGGMVIYYGKPHRPIYDVSLALLPGAQRPLAIGDGLGTDIKGANVAMLDALFIADGIHGEEVEPFTRGHLGKLLERAGVHARAAMRTLVW